MKTNLKKRQLRCHEIDNKLFTFFFSYLRNQFKEIWPGDKRFHWIYSTRVLNSRAFYEVLTGAEQYHANYHKNETLMFKLVFTSFTK